MSEYYTEGAESGGRKKYIVLGAAGIGIVVVVVVVALLAFSGMLDITVNDEPVEVPKIDENRLYVFTGMQEIMEGLDVPEIEVVPVQENVGGANTGLVPAENGVIEDVQDGDVQSLTELAINRLVDAREEFGLADEPADDDGGLTMEDILGSEPPDPEDVTQPGADILEKVEEFKKIPAEPVPDGATSGTVTWVLTGNTININEVLIHLTGVPAGGGVGDRDKLMRECPRDTLVLYTLDGRADSDGSKYGKVWCYGYPPTPPENSVNSILK